LVLKYALYLLEGPTLTLMFFLSANEKYTQRGRTEIPSLVVTHHRWFLVRLHTSNWKIEFVVKSGKHSTRTLSLVQNRVRWKKKPAKKYVSLQQGVKLRNARLSFIQFWPPLSCFLSASTAATYIFIAPTCTTTIITSNLVH
jgi:hypothetical protein